MNRAELFPVLSPKPFNWEWTSSTRGRSGPLLCAHSARSSSKSSPKILVYLWADLPQNLQKEFSWIYVVLYIFVFIYLFSSWKTQIKKWEITYFDLIPNATLVQNWNLDPQFIFFFQMGQRAREFLWDFPKPTCFLKIAAQIGFLAWGALHFNGIIGKAAFLCGNLLILWKIIFQEPPLPVPL